MESVSNIDEKLSNLSHSTQITQNDIYCIVQDLGTLFKNTAKSSFGRVKSKYNSGNYIKKTKPLFNYECRETYTTSHVSYTIK